MAAFVYARRRPEQTTLYAVVRDKVETLYAATGDLRASVPLSVPRPKSPGVVVDATLLEYRTCTVGACALASAIRPFLHAGSAEGTPVSFLSRFIKKGAKPPPDEREAPAGPKASAVPPPTPSSRPTAPDPWAGSTEALLDDVDAGFANIMQEAPPPSTPPSATKRSSKHPSKRPSKRPSTRPAGKHSSGGLSDARALFTDLAKAHVRQVRDFMIDLGANQAKTEWVAICAPAIKSLREMAEQLTMTELCSALDAFSSALSFASAQVTPVLEGTARERLVEAYSAVTLAMPSAFSLDDARGAREEIIVESLLLQVPDVGRVALDKLYKVGLTSLEQCYVAKPEEIAETTGISLEIAQKITERFRRYKQELQAATIDANRSFEHERLRELAATLAQKHDAFEQASAAGDAKAKREARKAREDTFHEVKALLARLGEVDRLSAMEKLPFGERLRDLDNFLAEGRPKRRG